MLTDSTAVNLHSSLAVEARTSGFKTACTRVRNFKNCGLSRLRIAFSIFYTKTFASEILGGISVKYLVE